ncbi:hypothetical protein KC330_g8867 [Hortaea werneckii]|nr:hypothetical protein KC330_g8867 [Hortaea werneckii]
MSTSSSRLNLLTSQVSQSPSESSGFPAESMADSRPFITCHVLDTVAGKPGVGIAVHLRLLSPFPSSTNSSAQSAEAYVWNATTNSDGRVTNWEHSSPSSSSPPDSAAPELNAVVAQLKSDLTDSDAQMLFSLTFETEAYYGKGKTFWPEVELRFAAKKGEAHYHVPLLLGPWSYTTYRGS